MMNLKTTFTKNNGTTYEVHPLSICVLSSKAIFGTATISLAKHEEFTPGAGDTVMFYADGKLLFKGRTAQVKDAGLTWETLSVSACRCLANKNTHVYRGITADRLFLDICEINGLEVGGYDRAGYIFPETVHMDEKWSRMLINAMEHERLVTGNDFCLYDVAGKVYFKCTDNLKLDLRVTDDMIAGDLKVETNTKRLYNSVAVRRENPVNHMREVFERKNEESIAKYGILQYNIEVAPNDDLGAAAENLLRTHSEPEVVVTGIVAGDLRFHAGARVDVDTENVAGVGVVEEAVHMFRDGVYTTRVVMTMKREIDSERIIESIVPDFEDEGTLVEVFDV